jgi:hypothetical protein
MSVRTDLNVAVVEWPDEPGMEKLTAYKQGYARLYQSSNRDYIPHDVMEFLQLRQGKRFQGFQNFRDERGWTKPLAFDGMRNYNDMTYQLPNPKALKTY